MEEKQKTSVQTVVESVSFMATLTFVGGFLDAYTYVVRGGVFANNQTGNVAKLGICLSQMDWLGSLDAFVPMLATILGAFFAEHFKAHSVEPKKYSWQKTLFLVEILLFIAMGFVPTSVPHAIVNAVASFTAGMQLSTFRSFEGWVHNTTICTGNLRSLGQYFYNACFVEKNRAYRSKTLRYVCVFSSFILGSLIGALLSRLFVTYSIWVCILPMLYLVFTHRRALRLSTEAAQ